MTDIVSNSDLTHPNEHHVTFFLQGGCRIIHRMATKELDGNDAFGNRPMGEEEFVVKCHCGRVQGRFQCNSSKAGTSPLLLTAWQCNCSDCFMRQNTHIIVPARDFILDMQCNNHHHHAADSEKEHQIEEEKTQEQLLEQETILYQWGTKTAIRRFCKTCGILPWYRPRSNPDGYAITIHCIDWSSSQNGSTRTDSSFSRCPLLPPAISIQTFDGVHWEETMLAMQQGKRQVNILDESK
jgi:hypothetical protein